MNLIFKIATLLVCLPIFLFGQEKNYSVASIPKDLLKNADAVVRHCKQDILIKNEKSMVINYTNVITVLNADGDKFLNLYEIYSNDSKITKISAKEYNSFGLEVRKYKKKDFTDRSAVSGFYSDNRVKFLDFTPRRYPYTIEFTYEFKTETTAFIPSWYPFRGYNISIEKDEYTINNPNDFKVFKNEKNFENSEVQNLSTKQNIHYILENKKAIKKEIYSPSLSTFSPNATVGLSVFSLKGYTALEINNWKNFGKWIRENLYESQITLNEATKKEVKNLVLGATSPLEKAKLIYEFMQNKTRYVYVGIGVGGWQPTQASDVDRLGYGDCKGLSNYTKALLDVVGIDSNWVLVYASNKKNFDHDFTRIQGNHMILNLPKLDHGKDVWLECTSQTIPFGFLGSFTDDRDVLVLEKDGGVIKHTPKYLDIDNTQISNITINLDSLGSINADLNIVSKGIQYNDKYRFESKTEKKLKEYYKTSRWSYNNNLSVDNYEFENRKDSLEFTEKLKVNISKYAMLMGDEMVLRMNVFNMYNKSLKEYKNRKQPFQINTGFLDVDTVMVHLPKNLNITTVPKNKTIENEFGTYKMTISKVNKGALKYIRYFYLKEGKYTKEKYSDYRAFIEAVRKQDHLKIALKKQI